MSKSPKQVKTCLKIPETSIVITLSSVKYTRILLLFLSVALHESGTRNDFLGPWLSNTEVYLTPFISTQNHTIAG
jgi:hypothetical protein